jgi:hypothetical protein
MTNRNDRPRPAASVEGNVGAATEAWPSAPSATQPSGDAATQGNEMIRWRIRKFFRSLDNYRRGFKFGYVRRCRVCDHTAYYPRHPDHSREVKSA